MTKAITAQSLRKVHPGNPPVEALASIDVEIEDNEFFTLLGPSGCGKTTLLRLIAGFEHPTSGTLDMFGESLLDAPPYKRPINTVFQNYALFPHMTVAENIAFGLQMLGTPKASVKATVGEMMELVQMSHLADRQTSQISGGQQQRVALARALAPRPKILLLDEPLSALDFKLRKQMQLELKRLQTETGITFIFVTHDQEEALTMSDRIAVMSNGAIRQIGRPRRSMIGPPTDLSLTLSGIRTSCPPRSSQSPGKQPACVSPPGKRWRRTPMTVRKAKSRWRFGPSTPSSLPTARGYCPACCVKWSISALIRIFMLLLMMAAISSCDVRTPRPRMMVLQPATGSG